jgi:hypothetical protein
MSNFTFLPKQGYSLALILKKSHGNQTRNLLSTTLPTSPQTPLDYTEPENPVILSLPSPSEPSSLSPDYELQCALYDIQLISFRIDRLSNNFSQKKPITLLHTCTSAFSKAIARKCQTIFCSYFGGAVNPALCPS